MSLSSGVSKKRASVEQTSCQSCRARKLRCSRTQPCSNCTQRGLACRFIATAHDNPSASVARDESQLLARVERLERLILKKDNNAGQAGLERGSSTGLSPKHEVNNLTDGEGLLTALVNADMNDPSKFVKGHPLAVHSLSEILTILNSGHDANHGWGETTLLVPPYQVSLQLLRLFELYIDPICCITHPQTTRAELETFYIDIAKYEEMETQHTAMMLSTMSLSIFFCRPMDLLEWGISETDNIMIGSYMHDAASNLLEQAIRSSRINLCAAQAAILMSYFIYHRDGPSPRYRHLLSTATFIASELRLPSMDDSDSYSKQQDDAVTKELKRRVFWHLASTEGLNYGSFPSHTGTIMDFEHAPVRWPSEFSDSGRISDHKDGNDVLQRPTAVTYLLARIKLAAISRRAAIPTRGHSHNVNQDSYDQILALDREFERFLNDLPYFFRLDQESCQQSETLESVFSLLPIMRYSISTAAHSRRLKLHQTFLLRQAADERYRFSRTACIASATSILRAFDSLPEAHTQSSIVQRARVGIATSCTHIALATLVIDSYFNQDHENTAGQPYQISDAFSILEKVGAAPSTLLGRSLQLLRSTYRQYSKDTPYIPARDIVDRSVNDSSPGNRLELATDVSKSHYLQEIDLSFHTDDAHALDELFKTAIQDNKDDFDANLWNRYFHIIDTP